MGEIIKATARFHEAEEPLRQKPIIQQDRVLPNTVRASIDSGRDNPFKPDGKIYKLADPIVDYYKYGPNQSRAQSPTDSQLLLGFGQTGEANKSAENNDKNPKRKKRRKGNEGDEERSCCRRWFCCCCGLCGKRNVPANGDEEIIGTSQYSPTPSVDHKTKNYKQTKIVVPRDDASDSIANGSMEPKTGASSLATVEFVKGGVMEDPTRNKTDELTSKEEQKSRSRCVIS